MELTHEQIDIINSSGNIKINAVAGSGKTTTIIEYARARPTDSKILYLAFNKSVKIDAIKKFENKGLHNVKVETAHSLAHRHVVQHSNYHVRPRDYKTYELIEILGIWVHGEKLTGHIIANHVNKFTAYFCNSNAVKVQDLNYTEVVIDPKAKEFVRQHYHYIETQTRLFLAKMDKAEIDITHDFYLKKFQLSNPQLNYDYILFDEGQDASPAMLDVFFKQKAVKVIVGDTHQQIYGWRYAVNSLEKSDYKTFYLSRSFRFSSDIARLAMEILKWKKVVCEEIDEKAIEITGAGVSGETKVKAVLARTNLGLLLKAIEYITEKKKVQHIYFEGNITSYTYADDGTSLYDVLNLYNGKHRLIKDKLIKTMRDIGELEDYTEKTEDRQLGMLVEIVKDYGNDIPDIINALKAKHVAKDEKEKAEIIFSTVHRCKGMEYDVVQLVPDFITEKDLKKNNVVVSKLIEEINLLYVAVTRTKNSIYIPENLLPEGYVCTNGIHKLNVENEEYEKKNSEERIKEKMIPSYESFEKLYSVDKVREKYGDAYKPWTIKLDDELATMYCEGVNIKDMAKHFGRSREAILSRIKKLELKEKYR
jgi:superfamily I DNA/RNA helicase